MLHQATRVASVVVTGASAGVGRAVVHQFAKEGAKIGLVARDRAALETVAEEVRQRGGEPLVLPADVADAGALFAAADEAEKAFGSIDVWVNDAMVTVFSPVAEITPEEFRRVTEVTYLGFVHGTMAALRHMRPQNSGTIVQVGSALAYRSIPLQSAYCGAKHAIRGFTDSLRSELLHENSGIRVTMVHLPAMNTPQFDWARTHMARQPRPSGRIYQPEVAARAIVHAAHHPHREYWLGRTTDLAVLGNMAAPGVADHYLANHAISGQMTEEPVSPDRKDNLFDPVQGAHALRGKFSDKAVDHGVRLTGTSARTMSGMAVLGLAAIVGFTIGRARG